MTFRELALSPFASLPHFFCLLLLTLQTALVLSAVRDARSFRRRFWYTVHGLATLFLVYLPILNFRWSTLHSSRSEKLPGFLADYGSLPAVFVILYELLTAAVLAAEYAERIRYRRSHLTADGIKEALDLLPAGIAFGRPDGPTVFRNLCADSLSRSLTGHSLADLSVFRAAAAGMASPASRGGSPLIVPDGPRVWQFSFDSVRAGDEPFIQLTATDITEQAAVAGELQETNRKLRDIRVRLDIYNRHADRIIIAQELLTARMAVHSEVGSVLLESRHYLKDPSSFDEERLLQALKNTNTYLLREYEEVDTARDPLADALDLAEAVGVDVNITGAIPSAPSPRRVLAAAIEECASNTVKHAEGDRLEVNIEDTSSQTVFRLAGNGAPPDGPVREAGGLLALRALTEQEHGTMQITSAPSFLLILRLPKQADPENTG